MFSEKDIQTIQKKKHVRIRKVYGCIIATGAVISTISLLFDLVFYVAKKEEAYEVLKMYQGLSSENVDAFVLIGIVIGIALMAWGIIGEQKEIYKKTSIQT